MLMTNQQSDKLAAAHVDFTEHGMLEGDLLDNILKELCKLTTVLLVYSHCLIRHIREH